MKPEELEALNAKTLKNALEQKETMIRELAEATAANVEIIARMKKETEFLREQAARKTRERDGEREALRKTREELNAERERRERESEALEGAAREIREQADEIREIKFERDAAVNQREANADGHKYGLRILKDTMEKFRDQRDAARAALLDFHALTPENTDPDDVTRQYNEIRTRHAAAIEAAEKGEAETPITDAALDHIDRENTPEQI